MDNTGVKVKLTGSNGNVFAVISKVVSALNKAGYADVANKFKAEAFVSKSYDAVLQLCMKYVDVS